jgi:hypothetical protein
VLFPRRALQAVPVLAVIVLSFGSCDGSETVTPGCGDGPACGADQCCVDGACGACSTTTTGTGTDTCTGTGCTTLECTSGPCPDDGNPCTAEVCDDKGECAHPPAAAGTVCRVKSGDCDLEEVCDGTDDQCPADAFSATCECPENGPVAGYVEHAGLRAIDGSGFVLVDTGKWESSEAFFDGLGLPKVALDALPLDRMATSPAGALATALQAMVSYTNGFEWEAEDQAVPYWVPQGITAGKAGGTSLVAVSWHYDEDLVAQDPSPPASGSDKGVRVSFADVSAPGGVVPYAHVLLVRSDEETVFAPITLLAGGIGWAGSYLYVSETDRGVRVFDLSRILEVSTAPECETNIGKVGELHCAYGYSHVLPQVGSFYFPDGLPDACKPKLSFLSVDAAGGAPSLIAGEYVNDDQTGIYSRLFRWPLDGASGRLVTGETGAAYASGAWYAGNRNLQGAAADGDKFFLHATRYSGALLTGGPDEASTIYKATDGAWAFSPEGIHVSGGTLWACTQGSVSMPRLVFSAPAADIP